MPETTADKTTYTRKTVDTCNSKRAEFVVSDKQLYSVLSDMSNLCSCKKTHKCWTVFLVLNYQWRQN